MKRKLSVLVILIMTINIFGVGYVSADTIGFFSVFEFENVESDDIAIIEKESCGNGKYVTLNHSEANVKIDFDITVEGDYYLWLRVRNTNSELYSLYCSVDHKEYGSVILKESAGFSWRNIQLKDLTPGQHSISLKDGGAKMMLDQGLITSDASFKAEGTYKSLDYAAEETVYMPGIASLEDDKKISFFEEKNGSWVIQAEDGNIEKPIMIYDDELANGEKYISAKIGTGKNTSPQDRKPDVQYKVNVSQKGVYTLWVRYYSPNSGQKSSYFSMDNSAYKEINTGNTIQYAWANGGKYNLDVGYHTINFHYREAGQRIDCFILTNQDEFWPAGLGSYPGEPTIPNALTYEERMKPRIYVGEEELISNTGIQKIDSRYMIPVELYAEVMGLEMKKYDDYIILSRNRDYIKFTADSDTAVLNGEIIRLNVKPFFVGDAFMADFDVICEAFGIKYKTDDGVKLYLDPIATEAYEESDRLDVYGIYKQGFSYKIENVSPSAKAIGYIKSDEDYCWKKGIMNVNLDGTIYGSFISCENPSKNVIKVKLIDGDEVTWLYKNAETAAWKTYDSVDSFIPHGDGVTLRPTFENIGYYLDVDSDKYNAEVYYRKTSEQGFKKALDPYFDDITLQYRGSITNLEEGTEYEVKIVLEKNGQKKEVAATTVTNNSIVPIAKEYKLSELDSLKDENGSLVFENFKGSADGWIKIVGDDKENTLDVNMNAHSAIYVLNSEYLIFENIKITGGYRSGVALANNSENIRIINCDISGFGKYGVVPQGGEIHYDYKNASINNDSGILIMNVGNILIERCYIHDPKGRTNSWRSGHPCGMNAVFVRSKGGVVIRYNDFVGSDEARWNDAIECCNNGVIDGGISNDSDIYGNLLILGNDDGIEFDDGQMNVRFYNNRVESFLCGISTVPQMAGPSYIYRNLFTNMGDSRGVNYNATKNGGGEGRKWNHGVIYFLNNTTYMKGSCIGSGGWTGASDDNKKRIISRNNILLSGTGSDFFSIDDKFGDPAASYDYDIICRTNGAEATVFYPDGNEKHGIFKLPEFVAHNYGQYSLAANSVGVDDGTFLDNFTDEYSGSAPDIGAFETDGNNEQSVLKRPIDITSDKYSVFVSKGLHSETVTFKIGNIEKPLQYEIKVNELEKWYSAQNENGTLSGTVEPNSELKITVTSDTDKNTFETLTGCVLLRLENGYSIPVTIYGK